MLLSDSGCRNRRDTEPPPTQQQVQAFWLLVDRYLKLEAEHKQTLQQLAELRQSGGFR